MAGVLEYLCYEILELASNKAGEDKKKQIMPRHIMLAIKTDVEFNKFLKGCDFKAAGRVPVMHQDKTTRRKKEAWMMTTLMNLLQMTLMKTNTEFLYK